ncbi:hypothetical protein PoB_003160500 [Plakobranchus ocellatus]|uniref:Uncharacterized protein n=1 Tax=Plakobranchus ocellatus TaxID=259542 RepID=A0AAV4AEC6_9GAST|nr:hypothetical protein PoB_003160500 [Plakobranchus ocellatus]
MFGFDRHRNHEPQTRSEATYSSHAQKSGTADRHRGRIQQVDTEAEYSRNLTKFQDCVDENLASCEYQWARGPYEINLALYLYLCSPEGRELASKLANSDCATLSESQVLLNEITDCYETFGTDMSDEAQQAHKKGTDVSPATKCKYVKNLKQCLIDTAPKACHDDMATFIKDIWFHAAGKRYEDLECFSKARSRGFVMEARAYLSAARSRLMKRALRSHWRDDPILRNY